MTKHYRVAVIGDWHLAFISSAVLASVGHKTALVKPLNLDATKWNGFPAIPVMEPGLEEMIQSAQSKNLLSFENGVDNESWSADFIWMAVDTPVNDQDEPQLEALWTIANHVAKLARKPAAFLTSSQIPLGFCAELEQKIGIPVVYVPENLRLGKGIETFLRADRTVLGCNHPETLKKVRELFVGFETQILTCNLATAEMVKHANNAFLATSISFANELARIGEKFGVDSVLVGKALKLDKRIGSAAYVVPGLGFAGGTLPRDLRVLQKLGTKLQVPTLLVNAVLDINKNTTTAISEIIERHCEEKSLPKTVLILGYTYKPDTDTLRRSLSIDLAKELKAKSYKVFGYDPMMNNKDLSAIAGLIEHQVDWKNLTASPAVVICMTARPNFKELDWTVLKSKPLIFDTQNHLPAEMILSAGLSFKSLWSPLQTPSNGNLNA